MQKITQKSTYHNYHPSSQSQQNLYKNQNPYELQNFHNENCHNFEYDNQCSLQEIDNTISLRQSQTSSRLTNSQNEQVEYLKQKLIETHGKLLKQLQNTNRLGMQINRLEKDLRVCQADNKQLQQKVQQYTRQINYSNKKIQGLLRNQERYKKEGQKYEQEKIRDMRLLESMQKKNMKMEENLLGFGYVQENNKLMKFELQKMQYENQQLVEQNVGIKNMIKKLEDEFQEERNMNEQLKLQIKKLQNELKKIGINIEQQRNKNGNLSNEIKSLKQQIMNFKILREQSENEIELLKNGPIFDTQRKKRDLQITKELVYQLESEQQMYENKGVFNIGLRNVSLANKRGQESNMNIQQKQFMQNKKISNKSSVFDCKLQEIEELETVLFNCNLQRKKIRIQIDRIQNNGIKSRQIIVKKKRLEEELEYQEEKIKKVKEELRSLRIP